MPTLFDYSSDGVVSRAYVFDLLSYFMDAGYVVIYDSGHNKYVLPLMPWREGDWKYILVFTRCYAISDSSFIRDCGELRVATDECAAEALKIPVDKADEIYAELSVEKVAHLPFGSEVDDIKEYVEHVNGELARLLREFITTRLRRWLSTTLRGGPRAGYRSAASGLGSATGTWRWSMRASGQSSVTRGS